MKGRILIVDDDKALCEELTDFFTSEGLEVEHVQSPEDGLVLLSRSRFDAILLDFKMPRFDGLEFLKRARNDLGNSKIFLMSGSLAVMPKLKEQGLSSLITGIYSKPFDLMTLHTAIKNAIDHK